MGCWAKSIVELLQLPSFLVSSVFLARDFGLETKRLVYQSVVLGVLLYIWCRSHTSDCSEARGFPSSLCWIYYGNRKGCTVSQHVSTIQLAERFGVRESISNLFKFS